MALISVIGVNRRQPRLLDGLAGNKLILSDLGVMEMLMLDRAVVFAYDSIRLIMNGT